MSIKCEKHGEVSTVYDTDGECIFCQSKELGDTPKDVDEIECVKR